MVSTNTASLMVATDPASLMIATNTASLIVATNTTSLFVATDTASLMIVTDTASLMVHSEICGMHLVKVLHRRHQWFFLVPISALTSVPTSARGIFHIRALPGPKKDLKRAKIGIFTSKAICDHLFARPRMPQFGHANQPGWPILNWTGWNKVGTQQRHQVKQFWVFFLCVNGAKTGSLTTKVAKKRPKYDKVG